MPYSYKKYDICEARPGGQYDYYLLLSDFSTPLSDHRSLLFAAPIIYCKRFNTQLGVIPPQWVRVPGGMGTMHGFRRGDVYILANNVTMVARNKLGEVVSMINDDYLHQVKSTIRAYTNFCED